VIEALVPFAAAAIVGLWGVLCLLAAGTGAAARLARPVPLAGLGLALAAALAGLTAPPLIGALAADGALVVDRLAALLDLVIVGALLATVLADPQPDADPRALWARGMALIAGAGAMLAVRAGDLPTLLAGLELATLAGGLCLLASRDGASEAGERAGRHAARDWLIGQGVAAAILWLGAALVVAATGTLNLQELGGRVGAVFLRWGASTTLAAVDVLQGPEQLPAGLIAHARDAAVEGMAPAALFIPGALLLVAGLLARAGVAPLLAGRTAVAGRAGLSGLVTVELVVRTGAIAALIRVLVTALHLPRVVFAPYGWGTAAAVIGGLSAVGCAIAAVRAADLRRMIAWAGAAQAGLTVLALAAAANFVAHAGLRTGGLQLDDHYMWGHAAGEAAVAAAIAGWIAFVLAAGGTLAAAAAVHAGRGLADIAGLARRSPLLTAALVVSLLGLAAAPPTAAFAGRALLVSAVLEDTNVLVQAMLAAGTLAGALLGWAALRALLAATEPGEGPRPRRAATAVAVALAGLSLAAGIFGHAFTGMAEEAAAGVAFAPGGKGRREWIERRGGH
jgi:NADH-quinone oxidoreductase subunit N